MKRDIKKTVRLSNLENEKLSELLRNHNLTFSDFARAKILNKKINTKLTQELLYEMNKIGNNLNQISKNVNTQKSVDIQVLQQLVNIEKAIKDLKDDY